MSLIVTHKPDLNGVAHAVVDGGVKGVRQGLNIMQLSLIHI